MKYTIISNINIEHQIDADSSEQALDLHASKVKLPPEYVNGSFELVKILNDKDEEQ